VNAIISALDAHTAMSTQALNSPDVQRGLKDILLNHAALYERPAATVRTRGRVTGTTRIPVANLGTCQKLRHVRERPDDEGATKPKRDAGVNGATTSGSSGPSAHARRGDVRRIRIARGRLGLAADPHTRL